MVDPTFLSSHGVNSSTGNRPAYCDLVHLSGQPRSNRDATVPMVAPGRIGFGAVAAEQRVTFCRICEAATAGWSPTVDDGRVTQLRPDPDHPLSRGYACPKGIAMTEVQNDPDRVLHPLRRRADGDVRARLLGRGDRRHRRAPARVRDAHGAESVGWYMGNPGAFSLLAHAVGQGLPRRARLAALLHGRLAGREQPLRRVARCSTARRSWSRSPTCQRTDFLLMVGANPLVSHGSRADRAARSASSCTAIVERGGRVVVVDPRRTETARAFEHVADPPDADAWLLLSLLHVIFEEGLADGAAVSPADGRGRRARAPRRRIPPEATEARTGVAAARRSARSRATSPRADGAAVYGRTGSCLGPLRHARRLPARRAQRRHRQPRPPRRRGVRRARRSRSTRSASAPASPPTARSRSRIGGFPDVLGNLPASLMPRRRSTTPGDGPDPRAVRLGRQPGAVGARRRRARARAAASST